MSDSQIIVENLSHTYKGGVVALDAIDLEIGVGLFGLLGSNGAGKSTLMRIICTLLEPKQGRVSVLGHDILRDRQEVRKLIGYLPQEFGAWRLQKVEEVLDTLAYLSGLTNNKERKYRIQEILESVGLQEVATRTVKQLSGGMLRRLGVAQALVHNPKVLILDEPTVGLDPEERQRFRQLMAELARDRILLLSTHIITDLGASCSEIALIHKGKLEFKGKPDTFIAEEQSNVYEITLSLDSADELELNESFEIVSRSYLNGKIVLRGIAKTGIPPQGAILANQVTLEESYLSFTLNQGREIVESESLEIAL